MNTAILALAFASTQMNHLDLIDHYSKVNGVPEEAVKYVKAIAYVESGLKNVPGKGAGHEPSVGVFQIAPATGKAACSEFIKKGSDLADAEKNIACGVKIFKDNLDKYNDLTLSIASHNSGSPVYCRATKEVVNKYGDVFHCRKGDLLNRSYVMNVKKAASIFDVPTTI